MKIKSVEDLKTQPESDVLVNYIVDRWKKGLYSLILVAGLPGTGKSSLCIRLKEKLHEILGGTAKIVDINDNLLDFVRFVKNANPEGPEPDIGVTEEISVLFPSRRAMSTDNVDLARILDTCRKKKVILFANAPIWTSIDSHMRSMANVYIQTIRVYKGAGLVFCKCYKLQTDPRTGKTYTHSFKRGIKDVNRCYVLKPNSDLWKQYESKKDTFLDSVYSKIEARQLQKLKKDEKLVASLGKKNVEGLTAQELTIYNLAVVNKIKHEEVGKKVGLSRSRVCQLLTQIRKKLKIIDDNENQFDE